MDAFVAAGGNFLDTADVYSRWVEGNPGGVSEEIIGRWMKARGNRQDIVLATKARGRMWEGPNGEGLSRAHLMRAVEDSLRRLQTDYIDLYQTHSDDRETPLDETLRALDDMVRAGKVRYVGASNYKAYRLCGALWTSEKHRLVRFDSLQPHYNLAHRAEFERELLPLCEDQGVGGHPVQPAGRRLPDGQVSAGQRRRRASAPRGSRTATSTTAAGVFWINCRRSRAAAISPPPLLRWPGCSDKRSSPRPSSARTAWSSSTRAWPRLASSCRTRRWPG
jgi:aryl-alcohol dehydrogenase-like predicted oxidoreductase